MTVGTAEWRRLHDAPQAPLVLACDFDGSARSGATFDDLARLLPNEVEYDVCVSRPPPPGGQDGTVGMFASLTRDVGRWAADVHAVLGYCAGSVFAQALADRIESIHGSRPIVVLLDPMSPSLATFHDEFSEAVGSMTEIRDSESHEYLRRAEAAVLRADPASFQDCADEIAAVYLEACVLNLERLGIDATIAGELAEMFASYGSYLASAAEMAIDGGQWDRCVIVASRGGVTAGVEVDVDADRLLADQRSVDIVARALGGERW